MTVHRRGLFEFVDPPVDDPNHAVTAEEYLDALVATYEEIEFPWHRLIPGLRRAGRSAITVSWENSQTPNPRLPGGAIGVWYAADCHMVIGYQYGLSGTSYTFAHETGHAVDSLSLNDDERFETMRMWHGYRCQYHDQPDPNDPTKPHPWSHEYPHNDLVWASNHSPYLFRHHEAFADAFVAAFCPTVWTGGPYGRFAHWPTDYATNPPTSHYDRIREIVLRRKIMAFTDVPENHSHREGIEWAAGEGLVGGYADGTFRPENPVNRGQLCTILHRQAEQNSPT